jgi:hypothetical protein
MNLLKIVEPFGKSLSSANDFTSAEMSEAGREPETRRTRMGAFDALMLVQASGLACSGVAAPFFFARAMA